MITIIRKWSRLAAPLAAAMIVAACSTGPFAGETVTVTASFDDVHDLVTEGAVRLNDVRVGTVTAIDLADDLRAEVTMRLDADAPVPAGVEAVLAKTSVLGERYVDLVAGDDATGRITDGTTIEATSVRSDLEDLVGSGTDLVAYVATDAVQATLQTAATAFGGRSGLITRFVDDLNASLATYQRSTEDILGVIDALDRVTAAYAPNALDNAAVLEDLRVAAAALQDQDEQLLDTLDDLSLLSETSSQFLDDNLDDITSFVNRVRRVLDQVVVARADVDALLQALPRQLQLLPLAALNEETQTWLDLIVCGVDDVDGDPSRDCTPPNAGERSVPPPYYPVPEACWDDPTPCQDAARGD